MWVVSISPWPLSPWERDLVPIVQEAGVGPQGQSVQVQKISPPQGFGLGPSSL